MPPYFLNFSVRNLSVIDHSDLDPDVARVDPCKAAKFNSIDYFSKKDFGPKSKVQSLELIYNRVFFETRIYHFKTIKYLSTQ